MSKRPLAVWFVAILSAFAARAQAQAPFFGGGGAAVAFDPEVGVIQSGALLDAQATVSADKRYVTLNMRPTVTRLQSLARFPVSAIVNGGGFVGGVNLPAGNAVRQNAAADNARNGDAVAPAAPSPDEISRTAKAWVFTRQGMYLVARLP